jgi:hypothetical protein
MELRAPSNLLVMNYRAGFYAAWFPAAHHRPTGEPVLDFFASPPLAGLAHLGQVTWQEDGLCRPQHNLRQP